MRRAGTYTGGVLAGVCIALGGTAFLSTDDRAVGALFFTVGLFAVCTFGFSLFTGMACFAPERGTECIPELIFAWLGNFTGAWAAAFLEKLTRFGPQLEKKAAEICAAKLGDSVWSLLILAFFCNILIYIAVVGYKKNPHETGKYLSLFFGVSVFVVCGFEHCVADMYYFSLAGAWSAGAFVRILAVTAGNAAGGVFIPLLLRIPGRARGGARPAVRGRRCREDRVL